MFDLPKVKYQKKEELYIQLIQHVKGLIGGEKDLIANLANISSLIFNSMEDINWAGFYLYKENQLVLGPFNGKPACIRITLGKGVCGTAAIKKQTIFVENVHEFEGHIACDGETLSEIVVPMLVDGQLIGVLDIDSIKISKFDEIDKMYLEEIVGLIRTECF
ncbi:MAG: hypothetical protein CVV02_11380 [Firmicutes bacterium HGW-Firmicutes-7]|nr:MAG: hypothetical protein CVV02_11380 [Firmicutes bacterium HGW-Firmicutes-7]